MSVEMSSRSMYGPTDVHVLPTLEGIPGDMICERCLPTERAVALARDLVHDDLSGDEQPVDVQED